MNYYQFMLEGKGSRKNVYVSRNMQLIARLLTKMEKKTSKSTLLEILKRKYFDDCTKKLANKLDFILYICIT